MITKKINDWKAGESVKEFTFSEFILNDLEDEWIDSLIELGVIPKNAITASVGIKINYTVPVEIKKEEEAKEL